MGIYHPPKYKVKRNGVWVTVIPEPVDLGVKKYDTKTYNTEINRKRLLKEKQTKNRENGL